MKSLDLNNIVLIDSQVTTSEYWADLTHDNDGSFNETDQILFFESNDSNITVNFNYFVESCFDDDVDSYDAPYSEGLNIGDVIIEIDSILINDVVTDVDTESYKFFIKKIQKELNY